MHDVRELDRVETDMVERAYRRASKRVEVQAAVELASDSNFFTGFSANISDGGLFVATCAVLPVGTEVDLSFSLPSGFAVRGSGVVRWVREVDDRHPDQFPGMGVQFTALDDESAVAIHDFIERRDPMFYID